VRGAFDLLEEFPLSREEVPGERFLRNDFEISFYLQAA
jgi:hypothetical protein